MWALITHSAPGDPVYTATHKSFWGPAEHLLALQIDQLNARLWQAGGGKGTQPQPITRPGAAEEKPDTETTKTLGDEIAEEDLEAYLLALNGRL